jgi:hypothetical protein
MGGSFLLGAGVAGLEIGAEYFQDEYWERDESHLMEVAQKEMQKIIDNPAIAAIKEEDDGFVINRSKPSPEDDDGFVINRSKPSTSNANPDIIETSEDPQQLPLAA